MSALLFADLVPILFGSDDTPIRASKSARQRAEEDARARDEALIARVRQGDEAAMREIMTEYFPRISRFVNHMIDEQDLSDDIAQDVLVHLWQHRDTWNPSHSIKAYVLGAARNRALNELKHRNVQRRAAPSIAESFTHQVERTFDIVDELSIEALVAVLERLISALPEHRRTALRLRYEESLSYPAIADILGVSVKSAEQLVALTVQSLRKDMRRYR